MLVEDNSPLIIKAASAVIYDSNNRVLLAQRSEKKQHDPGKWETVGGTMEGCETAEAAIIREIREELGENIIIKNLIFYKNYTFISPSIRLDTAVFWAQIEGEINHDRSEISNIGWFGKTEALELDYCVNCKKRILDYFDEESSHLSFLI